MQCVLFLRDRIAHDANPLIVALLSLTTEGGTKCSQARFGIMAAGLGVSARHRRSAPVAAWSTGEGR